MTDRPEDVIRRALASLGRKEGANALNALYVLLSERYRAVADNEEQLREHAREVERLWAERDRYREALEEIADRPCRGRKPFAASPDCGRCESCSARAALAAVRNPSQDRETPVSAGGSGTATDAGLVDARARSAAAPASPGAAVSEPAPPPAPTYGRMGLRDPRPAVRVPEEEPK